VARGSAQCATILIVSSAYSLCLPLWPAPLLLRNVNVTHPDDVSNLGRDALVDAGIIGEDARITVIRESPEDVGFREIFIAVDGKEAAMLRHGDSVSIELAPGPHRVRAHNTLFWKTHDIVLRPGEHARFTAINRAGFGTFGLLLMLGATPLYLTFERVPVVEPVRAVRP
jgi:hypothetical protein